MRVFNNLVRNLSDSGDISNAELEELIGKSQKTISRICRAEANLDAHAVIRILSWINSKGLNVFNYIDLRYIPAMNGAGIGFLKKFEFDDNENKFDKYISSLEEDGRATLLTKFPSEIYCQVPNNEYSIKRFNNAKDCSTSNMEFYPLSSLINFGFSPSSLYSRKEKIEILERVNDVFKGPKTNQLFFFSDNKLNSPSHSEIEILHRKSLLLIEVASFKKTIIAIENPLLAKNLYSYLNEDLDADISGQDSGEIIRILTKILKVGDDTNSLIKFYRACEEETKYGALIRAHLSPSIQEKLT